MIRGIRIGAGALVAAILASCAAAPYTGRHQLILLGEAEEIELGETAFLEIKARETLIDDWRTRVLEEVGGRIAAASGKDSYRWEFILIDGDEANAFALPGGKVGFFRGIFPYCEDDAGVAAVMAHEVAHAMARHGAERLSQARLLDYGGTAVSVIFSGGSPVLQRGVLGAYGMGGKLGVLLPFSRRHESEADEIGLVLMAKAGYDPRSALAFWNRLPDGGRSGPGAVMLSTHPSGKERLRRLEERLPVALEYYRKASVPHRRNNGGKDPPASAEEVLRRLKEDGMPH